MRRRTPKVMVIIAMKRIVFLTIRGVKTRRRKAKLKSPLNNRTKKQCLKIKIKMRRGRAVLFLPKTVTG